MINGTRTWAIVFLVFCQKIAIASGNSIDFDSPPNTSYKLTEKVYYGSRIETEYSEERNYDLRTEKKDQLDVLEPKISFATSYTHSKNIYLFSNIEIIKRFVYDERNKKNDEFKVEINQLFLSIKHLIPKLSIQVGRIRFHDEREWIFDEELDGIRLQIEDKPGSLEISYFKKHNKNLLERSNKTYFNNLLLYLNLQSIKHTAIGLYFLQQYFSENRDYNRKYFGLQSSGRSGKRTKYWINAALVQGNDNKSHYSGTGFDTAVYHEIKKPIRYSLFWGLAYGSGGENNNGFRQTGLQDNAGKYVGNVRLKYYGEVADPQLSNMYITTIGLGKKLYRNFSLEVIHHFYKQANKLKEVYDWEIEEETDTKSRRLGQEIDFIFSYKRKPRFKSSIIYGIFFPGDAFSDKHSKAAYLEYKFKFDF